MSAVDTRRRLLWHGVFLFLLGLLTGVVIPMVTNPRMGLSAHVGGVQNGMVLMLFGFLWPQLQLSRGQAAGAFWLGVYGMYSIWAALLLGSVFGTSRATPIAGAGFAGSEWQERLVEIVLVSGSVAILVASVLVLYGLRGSAPERLELTDPTDS